MYIILVIIIYSHNCFDAIMTKIQSKKVITTKKSVEASNILNLSKVELKGDILNVQWCKLIRGTVLNLQGCK